MKAALVTAQHWLLPALVLAAWEIFGTAGLLPRYLSTPIAIVAALGRSRARASCSRRWPRASTAWRPVSRSGPQLECLSALRPG